MGSTGWQINKAPLECTQYLLEKEINCDVTFKIGEDAENIKAHKLILSMRSPVFDRMFNGSFCESEKDPVIPDVTVAAFQVLLRYCYYECLDIETDEALSILYASTKYMLPVLEKVAREKLNQTLGESNVWDIYKYALSVEDTEFYDACMRFFHGDVTPVTEALQAEAFLNISHKVLLNLLHINDKADKVQDSKDRYVPFQNNIGISISEIELFKACNVWAEAECLRQEIAPTGANKRTVLGECLFLLRFPTMYYKDLVNVVYTTGILTQTEKDNLSQYKHRDPHSQCQVDFPVKERQFLVTTPSELSYKKKSTVFIESEKRLMLSRLWIFGRGSYRVTVRDDASDRSWAMKYDTQTLLYCTTEIKKDRKQLYTLELKPRLLEPGIRYSVTVEEIKSSDHPDAKLVTKWIEMGGFAPFNEIEVTCSREVGNCIYALTLSLV